MPTNLLSDERETFIDLKNINSRRIDELIEDAEIEAEIEAERRIRAKNTRIVSISIVSIVLLIFLYAGMKDKTGSVTQEDTLTKVVRAPLKTDAKPIPFPATGKPPEKIASAAQNTPALPKASTVKAGDTASAAQTPEPAKKETPTTAPVQKTQKTPTPSKFEAQRVSPPVTKSKPSKIANASPAASKPKISKPAPTASAGIRKEYFVQVGAFSIRENAQYKFDNLKTKGFFPSIKEKRVAEESHTIMISGFTDIKYGQIQVQGLKSSGFSPILKKNSDNTYAIVLGSFDTDQKARGLQGKLTDKGYFSTIQKGISEKVIYQVQLGKFSSEEKAKAIQDVLDRSGFKISFLRAAENL